MESYIGHTLGGRYEVREIIGTGGMAVVYKAYCNVLNRYVAIKVLKEEFAQDDEFRKRFYNEAQAVAKLSQNNIVSIYDVCRDENGANYIVMELCEGVTLKDYLRKKHHLTWQETLYFAQQVARALDHAHSRGIIHQDIKPQNIMLLRDGTAKVMDFGIASFANNQETRKVTSEAIGSVHYISPEQAKGITVDFRTDLYSLGIVMYEMLTGTLPFRGETAVAVVMQHMNTVPPVPSSLVPEIPKAMDEIVMHAMSANASQRYSSALDMYRDMERLRSNPNLTLNYSNRNSDLDATRAIQYDDDATQLLRPVDDGQQTQYVPHPTENAAATPQPNKQRAYQPVEPDDDDAEEVEKPVSAKRTKTKKKKGGSGKVVVGVIIVALLAAVAYMASGLFGGETETVSVPNFISLNYETDVKDNAQYSDFTFDVTTHSDSSGEYEDGEIIDQDPQAETQVEKGATITLTVVSVDEEDNTDDSNTVAVPSIYGKTYEDAQSTLRARGLSATRTTQSSDSVAEGTVIGSDPEAGTEVSVGSTVTVIVSSGPANTNQTVPDLTGMTQSAAQKMLESYGLALGNVSQEESDEPAGTVIGQTVPEGTEVAKGTSVGITIAKAAEQTPDEPDEPDEPSNPAGSGTVSFTDSNSRIVVSLPTDRDTCNVTVSVDGSQLYNHTVRTSNGTAECRVSYSGEKQVVVTIDGETVYNELHDFG